MPNSIYNQVHTSTSAVQLVLQVSQYSSLSLLDRGLSLIHPCQLPSLLNEYRLASHIPLSTLWSVLHGRFSTMTGLQHAPLQNERVSL